MSHAIAGIAPIMQLAYVPKDVDGAIAFWTKTMGAGPFFKLGPVAYKRATYMGQPANPDFTVLIGYWGDMQIELIDQHNDAPSIYKDWTDAGHEGLHHVCIIADDIAAARKTCTDAGAVVVQEIFLDTAEAFYVDPGGGPGTMVEVLERTQGFDDLCVMMRDAAKDWDGSDPVRALG